MGWIIRGLKYGSAGLLLTYLLYDTCGIKDIIRRSIIHGPDPLIKILVHVYLLRILPDDATWVSPKRPLMCFDASLPQFHSHIIDEPEGV